ncbi:MAG: CBS domain-containing protein [Ruminococcus sp.]|nr:CBS domain-containing protein [Ruminococcus sp.]
MKQKSDVAYLYNTENVADCIDKIKAHGYTAIPVITTDGMYVGAASNGDYLRFILEKNTLDPAVLSKTSVGDIIKSADYRPVKITAKIGELFERITEQNFVPVTDDRGVFIGIITRRDILKYLNEKLCNLK